MSPWQREPNPTKTLAVTVGGYRVVWKSPYISNADGEHIPESCSQSRDMFFGGTTPPEHSLTWCYLRPTLKVLKWQPQSREPQEHGRNSVRTKDPGGYVPMVFLLYSWGSHVTVGARKLEHDHPPTPNQRKKDNWHKSSCIHVPTFGRHKSSYIHVLTFRSLL